MLLKSSNTCFACFWMNHCTFSDSATSALVSFPNPLTLECWLAEGTLWEGQIWSCLFFPLILTIFVLDSNYVPNPVVTIHSRRGIWLPSKFAPLKHQGFHSTNQLSRVSGFGKLTSSAPLSLPCMTVQCPRLALLRLPCQSSFFSPLFSFSNFFHGSKSGSWDLHTVNPVYFRSFLPVELFGHHTLTTSSLFMFFVVY